MDTPQKCSWTERSIFNLREVLLPMIKYNMYENNVIRFWQDPWADHGKILCNLLDHADIALTGIQDNATLQSRLTASGLNLQLTSNPRINALWMDIRRNWINSTHTKPISWIKNDGVFKIKHAYDYITHIDDTQNWKWRRRVRKQDNSATENIFYWKLLNGALMTKDKLI